VCVDRGRQELLVSRQTWIWDRQRSFVPWPYNRFMVQQVLQAAQKAFGTKNVVSHLETRNGRVFGSIEVLQSTQFDNLDDVRRQRRLWDELRALLGPEATQVGPIVMEPRNLG